MQRPLELILERHTGRTFTGAVLHVASDELCLNLVEGSLDPERDPRPVTTETHFDLASLTKVFTASAVLRLVSRGWLALDDRVGEHLSGFRSGGKDRITVRHLLTHTSGLPSFVRLYGPDPPAGDPWSAILGTQLQGEPGDQVIYSDVGFMLLGRLVETISDKPLRAAIQDLVLDPLDLRGVRYGPCTDAAATEHDPWRGHRLQGEVHDENCFVLGGASGHAGLFGPAGDVAKLPRAYLDANEGFLPSWLSSAAIRQQAVSGGERRGLGWKLRSSSSAAPDHPFSSAAFGHYGFTGTAVWADPTRRVLVVLLTNRVYFGRSPEQIQILRREVFEAVVGALPPATPA